MKKKFEGRKGTSPTSRDLFDGPFEYWRTLSSPDWSAVEAKHRMELFMRAAKEVPAYTRFLKSHKVNPASIKASRTLDGVPITSKADYIKVNGLADLAWSGTLASPHVLTSTSGSTGEPSYFARSYAVNDNSSIFHELFFRSTSLRADKSTLVVICFGMGIWIGGTITYQAFEQMGRRGYSVGIITPGMNKSEILKSLHKLLPQYEQLVLIGYPPFIKDVLDEAEAQKIDFSTKRTALLFAAETFPETLRDYFAEKAKVQNVLTDTASIYGTAELGTMAIETPVSILLRRLALQNADLFRALFGDTLRTPTFAQYIPTQVSFECKDRTIYLTGDSAVPLVRYSIGDHGCVLSYDEVEARCASQGIDLQREIRKAGIAHSVFKLPFVYVYERTDLSTKLYGAIIYPEHVRVALQDKRFDSLITGRFAMITKHDEQHNEYLELNVELKKGARMSKRDRSALAKSVVDVLVERSSEYKNNYTVMRDRVVPYVVSRQYEHPDYFKRTIKQKWVLKEKA